MSEIWPQYLEYGGDLIQAIAEAAPSGSDMPIYATTPHGTYTFVVQSVSITEREGEDVVVLHLKEVK